MKWLRVILSPILGFELNKNGLKKINEQEHGNSTSK